MDQDLGVLPAILEPEAVLPVLGDLACLVADAAHQVPDDSLVEESVLQPQRGCAGLFLPGVEPVLDRFEPRQQVRCNVARLPLRGLSALEAHAAALHQAEEELLLLRRVVWPSQPSEVLTREAARVPQPGRRPATMENGVDGIERPVLVEEDSVREEVGVDRSRL